MPLSCCIITHNETDRIERCILAVRDVVDEIIVVDFRLERRHRCEG